jgi:NADH dehydrogenase
MDTCHPTVVVGGGAAGLELVARLSRYTQPGVGVSSVVLVDRAITHLWKPRLHDTSSAEHSFLSHASLLGYHFELGALESIDLPHRRIRVGPVLGRDQRPVLPDRWIHFSRLVLALGSEENDFGTVGASEHCLFLNTPEQAIAIREQFLAALMRTARGLQPRVSIAVVGGGATGVELMAELHRSVQALQALEPGISSAKVQFILIEASDRLLSGNPEELSQYATDFLQCRGTRLMVGKRVREVDGLGLHLASGEFVEADLKIWTAGVRGPSVLKNAGGLTIAASGRVKVDEWLQCEGATGVYALGDCAEWVNPRTGRPAPYTAQVASAQARYLAKALNPSGLGRKLLPFEFASNGTVVSLGEERAVGTLTTRFGQRSRDSYIQGISAHWLYGWLYRRHELATLGLRRALARFLVDRLEKTYSPSIKLH